MKRLFLIVVLISVGVAAAAQDDMPAMPPAKVQVATAEIRNMAPQIEVSGTVMSLNDSRIATEIEGVISWLADVGDAVDAGEVIARIDPRLMQVGGCIVRCGQFLRALQLLLAVPELGFEARDVRLGAF